MQARSDENYDDLWFLKDAYKHHPDCSKITDDMIKETLMGKWSETGPNKQTTIPYSFSGTPYWFSGLVSLYSAIRYKIYPRQIDDKLEPLMKSAVRYGLDKWTNITNGRIKFEEMDNPRFYSNGIYFHVSTDDSLFSLGAGAVTYVYTGNSENIKQAHIFYPDTHYFWKTWKHPGDENYWYGRAWAHHTRTLTHEIGHALGIDDFTHYSDIMANLKKTKEGVFCSLMDYTTETETFISECKKDCTPSHAVFPGPVDERAINNLYYNTSSSVWGSAKAERIANYGNNISRSYIASLGTSLTHRTIDSFFENVAMYPDKPLFPKKFAHFLADATVLSGIIAMEFPVWPIVMYSITNIPKYLPQSVIDQLPFSKYLTSNYSLYVLSLSHAIMQGYDIIPLSLTVLGNLGGTVAGQALGECMGPRFAKVFNYIPQAITARFFPQSDEKNKQENNAVNTDNPLINEESPIYIDIHDEPEPEITEEQTSWFALPGCVNNVFSFFKSCSNESQIQTQLNENDLTPVAKV